MFGTQAWVLLQRKGIRSGRSGLHFALACPKGGKRGRLQLQVVCWLVKAFFTSLSSMWAFLFCTLPMWKDCTLPEASGTMRFAQAHMRMETEASCNHCCMVQSMPLASSQFYFEASLVPLSPTLDNGIALKWALDT